MITPASPQAGAASRRIVTTGATSRKAPPESWPSTTSRIHRAKNADTSAFRLAVGAKIWASASQPRRSSRCGQSVGTATKLPRWPQVMLDCNWLTIESEHSNCPVQGVSLCSTRANTSTVDSSPG
jgi:hypothetical protein